MKSWPTSWIRTVYDSWRAFAIRDITVDGREPRMFAIDVAELNEQEPMLGWFCDTVFTNPFNVDLAAWHLEIQRAEECAVSAEELASSCKRR